MYVRCPNCGTSTRAAYSVHHGVTCSSCGKFTSLKHADDLGDTPHERFRRAFGFARAHRIDLASAYSVLLGIIPIDQAFPIPALDSYDPGFRDAVQRGFLTPQQANERGDRVLYATTISLNHGVEMKNAFLVADNRMPLEEAIERAAHGGERAPDLHRTGKLWSFIEVAGAVAMLSLLLLAIAPWTPPPMAVSTASTAVAAPPPPPHAVVAQKQAPKTVPSKTSFKINANGRVTQVSGPDPSSVLEGLCAHEEFAPRLSVVALTATVPPSSGDRLGIVRDLQSPGGERCVTIHRDKRTGKWIAGDGRNPIDIVAVPVLSGAAETPPL
jgi:hypothetical protein